MSQRFLLAFTASSYPSFMNAGMASVMVPVGPKRSRCVIALAAGDGVRLQPYIRERLGVHLPKQYVPFTGQRSMLEEAWRRAETLVPRERIFTIVGRNHLEYPEVRRQLRSCPQGTVIVQPRNRETGPGLLLALTYLYRGYPQSTVAVFPSDHFILKEDIFVAHVDRAFRLVESDPAKVVLIGVEPTRAEPEYGYILPGSPLSPSVPSLYRVKAFVEKPAPQAAAELLCAGALWNTMVMVFRSETLFKLARLVAPELYGTFLRIGKCIGAPEEERILEEAYLRMEGMNLSQGFLQVLALRRHPSLLVLPGRGFLWSDWGSPDRIMRDLGTLSVEPGSGAPSAAFFG
jgi:mannose-1-phosphate guanylyltransferase